MGDIFRRETAEHPEPFTGERLTTAIGGQVQIEHYHRYLFARSHAAGLDVLDVASGEGYGSALLAQVAHTVVGVEYAGPTVCAATGNFRRANLGFLRGDARALPFANTCMDLVVSFETIEHFDRQDEFLREIRRVLRPGGILIVSTPDRDVYSPAGTAANPFHVRELSGHEFAALLHERFRYVRLMRQRALIGSALLADDAAPVPPLVFERRGETHFEACTGLPRAPYLLAIASDRELPPSAPGLYIDRGDLDTESRHRLALGDELRLARNELEEATRRTARAEREATEAERRAAEAARYAEEAARCAARAMQDAGAAAQQAESERQRADAAEARAAALQRECEASRGSARVFLRTYLPHLRRRLLGQRP